jgi:hypothetical protein
MVRQKGVSALRSLRIMIRSSPGFRLNLNPDVFTDALVSFFAGRFPVAEGRWPVPGKLSVQDPLPWQRRGKSIAAVATMVTAAPKVSLNPL